MEMFHRILKTAVEGGASDVHLKIGTPVIFRINRQLIAIECPFPTEEWMNNVVQQVIPAHLRKRVEQEREAFLKEFKSQLFAAHAEVVNSPVVCALGEHHAQQSEPATICRHCYDRLQERVDVCEAALHIDLKEAAQIVYDAVWADPSDPSKTYSNAASALLAELRRRSGVSSVLGPFQPLDN